MSRLTGRNALKCGDARAMQIGPVPFDITGWTVKLTVKAKTALATNSDAGAILQKSVTSHTDQYNTIIELSATDTRVTPGKYVYDIEFSDGNPLHTTSTAVDDIEFVADVTKT